MALDGFLRSLPTHIGVPWAEGLINAAAYADDILLFAETKAGLSQLLTFSEKYFNSIGLSINLIKSFTISLVPSGREKKVKIVKHVFRLSTGSIPVLGVGDSFKYLGIQFDPGGRVFLDFREQLELLLSRLSAAPLKPQQRLFALRSFLIPSFYHQLSLGRFRIGVLRKLDVLVRGVVRGWLRLPHDLPVPAFHADVADGGLGIPSFRLRGPVMRLARLQKFVEVFGTTSLLTQDNRLVVEQQRLFDVLRRDEVILQTSKEVKSFWKRSLYDSVDGVALSKSSKTPGQHSWVADGTTLLSGRGYVDSVRTRFNCLPTKSRLVRGRPMADRGCRAGCSAIESGNHVIQHCFRSHAARIHRHNRICHYMDRALSQRGYEVVCEPLYRLTTGNLKPDLVATKEKTALILDVGVNGDTVDLDLARLDKINKYSGRALEEVIKTHHDVESVKVVTCILNWRGVWCPRSAEELLQLKILRKSDIKVISVRTLEGTARIFKVWSNMTARKRI